MSRVSKRISSVLLVAALVVGGTGCGARLANRVRIIDALITQARDQGAYVCAPRELALAVSHADFAKTELRAGGYWHALDEVETAEDAIRLAIAASPKERCNPAKTVAPPPPVAATPLDSDGDGILDKDDRCPHQAEDLDGFEDADGCPDPDNDGDGVLDKADRCPLQAEDADGFEDDDGCPELDNDKDGVTDAEDRCPLQAGPRDNGGCPDVDTDGDTVVDRIDRCPAVPGSRDNGGCPEEKKFIVVTKERIELKQKVHFATDKATIFADSFPMLDEIADVLKQREEVRVRIEGHTDAQGNLKHNLTLSQARADSVRRYLIGRGVAPGRMEARGFGPTQPVADNRTAAGREANRRVEFIITAQ